ncbi:MAG: hypothetical protein ABR534_12195 [Desulfotignum sp.]
MSGMSTQGTLDGLAKATGASRGKNTLVEIQAAAQAPLWFATYDRQSGFCAYLEMKKSGTSDAENFPRTLSPEMFGIRTVERIDAPYLYQHAKAFETQLAGRIFGGQRLPGHHHCQCRCIRGIGPGDKGAGVP